MCRQKENCTYTWIRLLRGHLCGGISTVVQVQKNTQPPTIILTLISVLKWKYFGQLNFSSKISMLIFLITFSHGGQADIPRTFSYCHIHNVTACDPHTEITVNSQHTHTHTQPFTVKCCAAKVVAIIILIFTAQLY